MSEPAAVSASANFRVSGKAGSFPKVHPCPIALDEVKSVASFFSCLLCHFAFFRLGTCPSIFFLAASADLHGSTSMVFVDTIVDTFEGEHCLHLAGLALA